MVRSEADTPSPAKCHSIKDARVRAICNFLESHLHEKPSLAELAAQVNLSVSRMCYLFAKETGKPPAEYARRLRQERAKVLLTTTFLTIKEVSGLLGFSSATQFVRLFRKHHGVTPGQYREKIRLQTVRKYDQR